MQIALSHWPKWHKQARCKDLDPRAFDVDTYRKHSSALIAGMALCTDCPVARACAADGAADPAGVDGTIRAGIPMATWSKSQRAQYVPALESIADGSPIPTVALTLARANPKWSRQLPAIKAMARYMATSTARRAVIWRAA